MKIIIIGSGISGAMASGALKSLSPTIYTEDQPDQTSHHKAIMRIRDPRVGLLLGCDLKPIRVHKSIWFKGKLHSIPDIQMNNLYSLKLYNEINIRSLSHLGDDLERYLLRDQVKVTGNAVFNLKLIRIKPNRAVFESAEGTPGTHEVDFDYCISTIPLPALAQCCGIKHDMEFKSDPIFVYTSKVSKPSDVHQTIYYPAEDNPCYRATLQDNTLIIECMWKVDCEYSDWLGETISPFGLDVSDLHDTKIHKQKAGKLLPVDGFDRKELIWKMTNEFKVFSFGRFALWRPLRADHLVDDIEKIKRMMHLSSSYDKQKEEVNESNID